MNNEPTQGTTHKLTKKERRNAAWRWSLIGSNNINYGTLQGTGYAWSMAKTLRKIYPNDNDYVEAMRVEYEYFNITPYILDSQKIITWSGAQHLRCYIIATASS